MVSITKNNIRQNIFETVYDTLKAKATSSSYGTSTQPTITASYIDSADSLPEIVIGRINNNKEDPVFNRANYTNNCVQVIGVYAKKNKEVDVLTDNIDEFLHENKITGVTLIDWNEEDDIYITNQNKLRSKTITITWKTRR